MYVLKWRSLSGAYFGLHEEGGWVGVISIIKMGKNRTEHFKIN